MNAQLLWWGPLGLGAGDYVQLLAHFAMLSLLAVGGAVTTVPDMQRFMVLEKHWLSDAQFAGSVALAQAAPGPNVLFVAVMGFNAGGLMGVLATLIGTLVPPCTLTFAATRWSRKHERGQLMRALTTGLAPVTLGLLLATGWLLLRPAGGQVTDFVLAGLTVLLMTRTRVSPLWPLAAGAAAGAMGWV